MQQFQAKESKTIGWARYDEATSVLEVDFRDKHGNKASTYAYDGVSKEAWDKFNMSESKGRYFASEIRNQYKARKL